jgi:hypothetical protein
MGILLFLLKLEARRQIKYEFDAESFLNNLNVLAGTKQQSIAHPDTLAHLAKKLSPEQLSEIITKMINRLIRMRCLEQYRLFGKYYVIAVDGTGYINFGKNRHCSKCLTKTIESTGEKIYYHPILEAKLVTVNGLALSVATEFIENTDGKTTQDCEQAAFYRLAERLKKRFPQLPICLALDSLYPGSPVFEVCRRNNWIYVITFKEGRMPDTYKEAMTIKSLQKENRFIHETDEIRQEYSWGTDIDYEGHVLYVLECKEYKKKGKTWKKFVWLTDIEITKNNCVELANKGGRIRWKIENEGFNMQKNGGYELEHIYCSHPTAMKNIYYFLQIAHFINQLMEKGSLLKNRIQKIFGSIRNLSRRLLEGLRTISFTLERLQEVLSKPFQIRFDTS